ncbi:MAG: hypothetical protein E6Q97_12905 [Desulfurellales bacterium]|nr:MAG: hypothetical protein E6Q97_12905 [Desulfurellales bacterium]
MSTYLQSYRVGTLSVANGSTSVTGTLTLWAANVMAGDLIIVGSTLAEVASVESNTALTLVSGWTGTTVTGSAYVIHRWSRGWLQAGTTALLLADYVSRIPTFIPTTGAPSDAVGSSGNIAVDTSANVFYVKGATTWGSAVSMVGPTGPAGASQAYSENLLINGDFQINQRVAANGAIAAGAYWRDRWKADTGGANASLTGYVVTLSSGTIMQVIETAQWGYSTLASVACTVSVEDPSSDLTITLGTVTGTITAGSGRRSVTITPSTSGNLNFKITKATAGTVTFGRVKVEVGSSATSWMMRPAQSELRLCMRYYQKSYFSTTAPGATTDLIRSVSSLVDGAYATGYRFPVGMRSAPTVAIYHPSSGTVNQMRKFTTGATMDATVNSSNETHIRAFNATSGSDGDFYEYHFTADAEL